MPLLKYGKTFSHSENILTNLECVFFGENSSTCSIYWLELLEFTELEQSLASQHVLWVSVLLLWQQICILILPPYNCTECLAAFATTSYRKCVRILFQFFFPFSWLCNTIFHILIFDFHTTRKNILFNKQYYYKKQVSVKVCDEG